VLLPAEYAQALEQQEKESCALSQDPVQSSTIVQVSPPSDAQVLPRKPVTGLAVAGASAVVCPTARDIFRPDDDLGVSRPARSRTHPAIKSELISKPAQMREKRVDMFMHRTPSKRLSCP